MRESFLIPQLLFLQIAAFLTMIDNGLVPVPDHVKREAHELLEKLGDTIADDSQS